MPVVFRADGFRFFFYSHEGDPREPVHIHVRGAGGEAKFWLDPQVTLARSKKLGFRELRRLMLLVERHRNDIEVAWHEHFSQSDRRPLR